MIKPNYPVILPPTQHHSFFRNLPPYDTEGPSPLEETNNVVVEPIALNNRDFMESYVLDMIDPLMQSTQLGIDLYTKALDLVRESIDLLNGL